MAIQTIQSDIKQAITRHLAGCIVLLFVLLSALGVTSYWMVHAGDMLATAVVVHSLLLVSAFVLVANIAWRNQKRQYDKVAQNQQAQSILFDIIASINTSRDLGELLNLFCEAVHRKIDAEHISVWLITENNWLEFVDSKCNDETQMRNRRIRITPEISELLTSSKLLINNEFLASLLRCDSMQHNCYFLPLDFHKRTLGVLCIELKSLPFDNSEYFKNLIVQLGLHLGIAIEKARIDLESRRMLIMQERSLIANELHDSLAQTLASLRFQVRVLDETLQPTSEFQSIHGIEQVENSLDEAYSDLRELIAHCRTPINKQGLVPAIEKLISRFRKETGMHVLLQKEWHHSDLPPNMEMHLFRIIQEALNNIRKHSNANNVRVMLRCDDKGNHHVLVENDGVGFETPTHSDHPGKHLGLTIMRERAAHLGGKMRIESDPEEGTRIELQFKYNNESKYDPLQRLSGITK
ncbi:MAG: hypothetical protein EP315_03460 [Gammaproteobacteria bacterium]|nr:MAG: hypothetical protein EP315_03460 [Gammaproteobacteria bacterium]